MTARLQKTPAPHVLIIGGGLAGLATAVALAEHGLRLTILESRPRLGGRASSFPDPLSGELVDNCQHVSMACCTNLADFCERVGTGELFQRVRSILYLSPEGRRSTLQGGWLPAPLHLANSFLRANYLSFSEKLRVAYGLAALRFAKEGSREPFADWLRRHRQTPRTMERYWGAIMVSALNERLERIDLGHARMVMFDGFLRNRRAYELEVPTVPLGELYGSRLESWLDEHGVDVRLTTGARSIDFDGDNMLEGVTLRTGEAIPADFVALAVPFDRVEGLLGPETRERIPSLDGLDQFQNSPITGIHLWFDREVCPVEHAVTLGQTIQWVFNHTAIQGRRADEGRGQYLQLVVSASGELAPLGREAIVELVLEELATLWPEVREATLVRSRVVTEHGATFSVRPGIDQFRPPQRTPIDGLFLAGDWTATGWPATMEGAVRSGYLVAEGILQDLDRPQRLIRPDLPSGWLARLLLGPRRSGESEGRPRFEPKVHREGSPIEGPEARSLIS